MAIHRRNVQRDSGATESFAAQPIDMATPEDVKRVSITVGFGKRTEARAWDWYEKLGEVHQAVGRAAKVAGYADLGVYTLNADGTRGKLVTGGTEAKVASMLYSSLGGQRGLIERFFEHIKVPGDTYLIRCRTAGQHDGYDFVSAREWEPESLRAYESALKAGDTAGLKLKRITQRTSRRGKGGNEALTQDVEPGDVLGRVWRPGSYLEEADSPLYALDDTCEILHWLTRGILSKLKSRLAMNGAVTIAQEVNEARSAAPTGKPGEFHNNKVIDQFLRMSMFSALNPDDPTSSLPVFLTVPGALVDSALKFHTMDRSIDEIEMKLRAEMIERILFGLDINPQMVKGAGEANHWGAWAASDDEKRVNIQPDLDTLCWALTRLVLRREMLDAGIPAGRINKRCVGWDLSRASAKTNPAEDALQLADRIAVGPKALRRLTGVDEADAPDELESVRMIGVKNNDPYLATFEMDVAKRIDWDKVGSAKTGPAADSAGPPTKAKPGKGQPGSPSDNQTDTPKQKRPA